jgi:hypothetical protein
LATPNYGYEKRQRELAKKRKAEEKRQKKLQPQRPGEAAPGEGTDAPQEGTAPGTATPPSA